jgi:hypothetical protein
MKTKATTLPPLTTIAMIAPCSIHRIIEKVADQNMKEDLSDW